MIVGAVDVEVVVLGGGPAGIATAIVLNNLGRSVAVVERSDYSRPRAGETLGGEVKSSLAALGVWDQIEPLAAASFTGVLSAWGVDALSERPSILHPLGEGLHVERARFDSALANAARSQGVNLYLGTGRCSIEGKSGAWQVSGTDFTVCARYLIDASGRAAPATKPHFPDRRWIAFDRLVGVTGRFTVKDPHSFEPEFTLESVSGGWWYSAPQPDGTLLVTKMTDRDMIGARGRKTLAAEWRHGISRTTHIRQRVVNGEDSGEIDLFGADSGFLEPDRGPGWRAVGDAAMSCDPLAGNGVWRALKSGMAAAEEINRELAGEPQQQTDVPEGFNHYLAHRDAYYLLEQRWPEQLFWARRQPIDWENAPILLDPMASLKRSGDTPTSETLAPIESLIPPRAVELLLEALKPGLLAHEAMTLLRNLSPLPDARLLAALQLLCSTGVVYWIENGSEIKND